MDENPFIGELEELIKSFGIQIRLGGHKGVSRYQGHSHGEHCILAKGKDLVQAYNIADLVEYTAKIAYAYLNNAAKVIESPATSVLSRQDPKELNS